MLNRRRIKKNNLHRAPRSQVSVIGSGLFSSIKPIALQGYEKTMKPALVNATKSVSDNVLGKVSNLSKIVGKGNGDEVMKEKTKGQELLSKYLEKGLERGQHKLDSSPNDFLRRYINKPKVGKGLNVI